jgi:hypothetical protein
MKTVVLQKWWSLAPLQPSHLPDSVYFVTRRRRVSATRALQEALRLRDIAALSALAEIVFGPQGRQLLGHRDIYELVESYAFRFRNAARLFQY